MWGVLEMPGRLEGKVALISGAARGQGRSHALRLAQEGADIIAFDACCQLATVPYPLAAPEDLAETVRRVEELDRRILAREVDVRDSAALRALVEDGVRDFGRLDVVSCNAGVVSFAETAWALEDDQWEETLAVNLTGTWKTAKAAIPAMIEAGNGGSIIMTSSTAGSKGYPGIPHYSASKHGIVGLARSLAVDLAQYSIRVNTVHPTGVNTPMIVNDWMVAYRENRPPTAANMQNLMPVETVEAVDISNAIVWLASDEARYVTGIALPVDAGFLQA
jgi:SDR family mycofactocin-dependent oxidoreductase